MMASSPPPELELKDDILKLSMLGDEVAVKALLDSGKVSADWIDAEGIGPLHVFLPPSSPCLTAQPWPQREGGEYPADLGSDNRSGLP